MSENNGNGGGILGTIVSWKAPPEIGVVRLRDAARQAGLGDDLIKDLSPVAAMRRALKDMGKNRVIRKVRVEGNLTHFQMTHEYLQNNELQYAKEADVTVDENSIVRSGVYAVEIAAQRLLNEHMVKREKGDVTRIIQKIFKERESDLIPIREEGGAYFVPFEMGDLISKVKQFLETIGGNLRCFEVRLGAADTSASVAESMAEYLVGLIAEFEGTCKDVCEETSQRIVTNRFAKAGELRQKLNNYQGLLLGMSNAIREKIEKAEEALMKKVKESSKVVA